LTGQELSVTFEAADEDVDDVLVFKLLEFTGEGAQLDSLTGVLTWVPAEVGEYTGQVAVTDGKLTDSVDVVITVEQGILLLEIVSPKDGDTFSVNEGDLVKIVFLINNEADSLEVEVLDLPEGAVFVSDTVLEWTPGPADAGQYPILVTYTNETGGSDQAEVTIRVRAVNSKPVWVDVADTLKAKEGETFSHTFTQPVDEDPDDIVVVSARNLPPGAMFDAGALTLDWQPGFEDAGVYQFILVATDLDGARGTRVVTLIVENSNRPPQILLTQETIETNEGEPFSFTVPTFDQDGDLVSVVAQNLPEGALFLDPVFTWTTAVEGEYLVTFVATDPDSLEDTFDRTIVVLGVNEPPVFDLVPAVDVDAGEPVTIEVIATDPDGDELTYSLVATGEDDILSRGADFTGRTFTWTPSASDIGPNIVSFMVQDPEGLEDMLEATITVTGRNIQLPPEFDVSYYEKPIVIEEGQELFFDLSIAVTEAEREDLSFWVSDLPEGAEYDEATALITWTPNLAQSGTYGILCGVSDGNFQDLKTLVVEVTEKDVPPVLEPVGDLSVAENMLLKLNLMATDASGEPVTFDADGLPEGAQVFSQGLVKFRPTFEQQGDYQVTFYAIDASGNTDEETVTLTVEDVNRKPELVAGNQAVAEGGSLVFNISATDPDGDEVSYTAEFLPAGAVFDETTGVFEWSPTLDQGGNYVVVFIASDGKEGGADSTHIVITVGDVNRPPEIDPVGDQVVDEGSSLTFEINVSDPDATDQLTIAISGLPEEWASLAFDPGNPVTAVVEVNPGYLDGGVYEVQVTVDDNNAEDPLSVSRRFVLEVADKDIPPAFTGQLAGPDTLELTVDEGRLLEIQVSAEDPGGDALSYSTSVLPRNVTVDFSGGSKQVSFTPDYRQSGVHRFDIIVTDGAQRVSKTVKVTVNEVNLPPVVSQIQDQSVDEGDIITFEVNYRDPDDDEAEVFVDKTRVPFLTLGDPAPARIRDGKVFVFDTALLPPGQQISSAVFYFWAEDVRGGVSDTVRVEIAVVRSDSAEAELASGTEQNIEPEGFGLIAKFKNNSGRHLGWLFKFLEKSGFLERAGMPTAALASAGGTKVKPQKGVYTYLAGDLTSQFYGIRRGWGLDLSAQEQVEGTEVEMVLSYFDEDLPTEIPNFTEERLAVFGYDATLENWVRMTDVVIDTETNQATFKITDYAIVDYTIGAVLDVVAPVITDLKVLAGNYTVVSTGVDTTYELEGPFNFRVNITDDEIVSSTDASFYYSLDGVSFEAMELERTGGNLFTAQVSGPLSPGSSIYYYVTAQDNMNSVSSPAGAPVDVYKLVVLEYTAPPGDVDESGKINIFDLLKLLSVLSGAEPTSLGSDVNQDSKTNIFDLLALLSILAG